MCREQQSCILASRLHSFFVLIQAIIIINDHFQRSGVALAKGMNGKFNPYSWIMQQRIIY
jgi:hypothetical protein